jgi:uncharacterized protein YkwD
VALLFGLSLMLTACNASSVREFLAELFPPPAELAGDEVASEDASEDDAPEDDPSEESTDGASEPGDTADDGPSINQNEHCGARNLRPPPRRDETRKKDDAGDERSESEDDEAPEQEDADNASEEEEQDRPAERQPPERAPAAEEDSEPEDTGGQSSGLSSIEQEVFSLLNAERERAGLSPLELDSTLSQGARAWSRRMATEGFFEHDTSGNFAENIAYGYPTAAAVHDGWMNSEGHRTNRMNSRYTTYGVGVFEQGNTLYYTERFR